MVVVLVLSGTDWVASVVAGVPAALVPAGSRMAVPTLILLGFAKLLICSSVFTGTPYIRETA